LSRPSVYAPVQPDEKVKVDGKEARSAIHWPRSIQTGTLKVQFMESN